jgi:hypothetical protein
VLRDFAGGKLLRHDVCGNSKSKRETSIVCSWQFDRAGCENTHCVVFAITAVSSLCL